MFFPPPPTSPRTTIPSEPRRAHRARGLGRRLTRRLWAYRPTLERLEDLTLLSVNWINPFGGEWSDPVNWDSGHLPGATDDVEISIPGITVTHSTGNDQIRSLTSSARLDIRGGSLKLSGDATLGGDLTVKSASSLTLTGGSTLHVGGTLLVTDNSAVVAEGKNVAAKVNGQWAGVGVTIDATNVTVDASSRISADGQGYTSPFMGNGPGGGGYSTTLGIIGGGYGGEAGAARAGYGGTYGSPDAPTDLGSGGAGAAGGGAIRLIVADALTLEGKISANGQDSAGGGSGGSIWVTADSLTGSGTFSANGGDGLTIGGGGGGEPTYPGSGGGGGRIAVYYRDATNFAGISHASAAGGRLDGQVPGGGAAGSVAFVDTSVANYHLRTTGYEVKEGSARRFGEVTVIGPGTLTLGRDAVLNVDGGMTITDGATLKAGGGSTLNIGGTLLVTGNSTVLAQSKNATEMVNGRWAGAGVSINASGVTISAGSKITADGQGYTPGASGVGNGPGGGAGGEQVPSGGGYGGAAGGARGSFGQAYGSSELPIDLGSASGGGTRWDPNVGFIWNTAGAGGGAIGISVADTLTVDGRISADGQAAPVGATSFTGGSGGSVWVMAGRVAGSGTITADGADGVNTQGAQGSGHGGGGGRVAVYYLDQMTLPSDHITAAAGAGVAPDASGSAGTVFLSNTLGVSWPQVDHQIYHGVEALKWAAALENAATIDILLVGSQGALTIASGLPVLGSLAWDTTTVPDSRYELRMVVRDIAGQVIGSDSPAIQVINSAKYHSGRVTGDETWAADQVHVVEGRLTVASGVTLTIDPGTVVKFLPGTNAGLVLEAGAALEGQASQGSPIILTSLADDTAGGDTDGDGGLITPQAGDWAGITAAEGAAVNLTRHVQMRFANQDHSGRLTSSQTWVGPGVYHVTDELIVPAGVTLTIQPGAVVKFDAGQGITVEDGGGLIADGTVAMPIVLTSFADDSYGGDTNRDGDASGPGSGDWRGLLVQGVADLNHAQVLFAGKSAAAGYDNTSGAIVGSGNVTIANSVIRDAFYDAILTWGGATVSATNTVIAGADRAVNPDTGSSVRLINSTLDGNRIGIWGHGGAVELTNTIISNSSEIGVISGAPISVRFSNVWSPTGTNYAQVADPTGLEGNISADPKYRDAARGDYRPHFLSPVIDAADGSAAPATDLMGAPRYNDPRTNLRTGVPDSAGAYPDMGAYEFVETAPSPLDLAVTSVLGPATALAGDLALVQWTIRNEGTAAIAGPWHDGVYLVQGTGPGAVEVLAREVLVGAGVTLGPGQSQAFSAQVRVPGGAAGDYAWQVKTNTLGEVFEGQNRDNNSARSAAPVALDVPELPIDGGSLLRPVLSSGESHWFKFVPQAGQDVLVQMNLTDSNGGVELYLGQGYLPDRQHFDARQTEWNSASASAVAASASGGAWYVLAYTNWVASPTATLEVSASTLGLSLQSVGPNIVSNRGAVTVEVRGGELGSGLVYEIVGSDGVAHEATAVTVLDSNRALVTFDLFEFAPGHYDLKATREDATVPLSGALTVQEGGGPFIWAAIVGKDKVRTGRETQYEIIYGNSGDCDSPGSIILIQGLPNGATIIPGPEFIPVGAEQWTTLQGGTDAGTVLAPLAIGPLRPGARGSARFTVTVPDPVVYTLRALVFEVPSALPDEPPIAGGEPTSPGGGDAGSSAPLASGESGGPTASSGPLAYSAAAGWFVPVKDVIPLGVIKVLLTGMAPTDNVNVRVFNPASIIGKDQWGCTGAALDIQRRLTAQAEDPDSPLSGWTFQIIERSNKLHTTVMATSPDGTPYVTDVYLWAPTIAPLHVYVPPSPEDPTSGKWEIEAGWLAAHTAGTAGGNAFEPYAALDLQLSSPLLNWGTFNSTYRISPYDPYGQQYEQERLGAEKGATVHVVEKTVEAAESQDPNEKDGPDGVGERGFISGDELLHYTIYFENLETAGLPAQQVVVTDELTGILDWSTLQLGAIRFNDVVLTPNPDVKAFSGQALVGTDANPVKVTASLDPNTGVITWDIMSIDPVTGQLTEDPLAGFLPPNDATHRGEGSVSFTIRAAPQSSPQEIHNQARIVFDVNAAIDTNEVLNTIDLAAPTSQVAPLPASSSPSFTVSWSGSDPAGSGVATYEVYVSVDGGPFQTWVGGFPGTSAVYEGKVGHTYAFYSLATDKVGRTQAAPGPAQMTTVVRQNAAPTVDPISDRTVSEGNTLTLQASATDPDAGQALTFSLVLAPTGATLDAASGALTWATSEADGPGQFAFTIRVSDGELTGEGSFTVTVLEVHQPPTFAPVADQFVDEGQTLSLALSATDADLPVQTLTYALVSGPAGLAVDPATGVLTWSPADGPFTAPVTVRVTDDAPAPLGDEVSFTVTVSNVAPTATFSAPPAATVGVPATFRLTDPADVPADADSLRYSYDLDGDGAFELADAGPQASYTYLAPGTYTARARVADKDGDFTDYTATVTVTPAAPATLTIAGPATGVRGQPRSFTFTLEGVAGPAEYRIDWGDGAVETLTAGPALAREHAYAATGDFTVTAQAAGQAAQRPIRIAAMEAQPDPVDPARLALVVGGTAGQDVVLVMGNGAAATVLLNGVSATQPGAARVIVYAGGGDDVVMAAGSLLPVWVFGGGGDDVIFGGQAGDLLSGEAGDDVLYGLAGDDVLLGGAGADVLFSGPGEDLMVGGPTAFDLSAAALAAVCREWQSGRPFEQRVANLSGDASSPAFADRLNGGHYLKAAGPDATVFDDGEVDTLVGQGGRDWLFASLDGATADLLWGIDRHSRVDSWR